MEPEPADKIVDYEVEIPVVEIPKLRCPYCGRDQVRQYGAYGRVRYYRCKVCVKPRADRERVGQFTTFKVVVKG